jgi:hypothetical protein
VSAAATFPPAVESKVALWLRRPASRITQEEIKKIEQKINQ